MSIVSTCSHCGHISLHEGDNFCSHCGHGVVEERRESTSSYYLVVIAFILGFFVALFLSCGGE